MLIRLSAAVFAAALAAACGSTAPTTQPTAASNSQASTRPTASAQSERTAQAEPSGQPEPTQGAGASDRPTTQPPVEFSEVFPELTATDLNPAREPLPDPVFETADEIVEAMFTPGLEAPSVISMLEELGIGLYRSDGTPITAGTEASDDDFYVYEDEAYGLIALAEAQSDGEQWINFSDFHAALAEFGIGGTAQDLIDAYSEVYADHPDAPMAKFVQAQAFLDVEAQLAPLGAWLLFLDGMVPPHAASAGTESGIGLAYERIQELAGTGLGPRPNGAGVGVVPRGDLEAHIWLIASNALMKIDVQPPTRVHEGHGGPGDQATFTATVKPLGNLSAFGGGLINRCAGDVSSIPVTWEYGDALTAHGSATVPSGGNSPTDNRGDAKMTFTAKQERDNSRLFIAPQTAQVTASVSKRDIVQKLCGPQPATRLGRLIGAGRAAMISAPANLLIEWHEPVVMKIRLTNEYHLTLTKQLGGHSTIEGIDTFEGALIENEDGTWSGNVWAHTDGGGSGSFAQVRGCVASWNENQMLEVVAERKPGVLPGADPLGPLDGDFILYFTPAAPPVSVGRTNRSCPPTRHRVGETTGTGGAWYAPFNDTRITDPDMGLAIVLPAFPDGGTGIYRISDDLSTVVIADTYWRVEVEYPQPPP